MFSPFQFHCFVCVSLPKNKKKKILYIDIVLCLLVQVRSLFYSIVDLMWITEQSFPIYFINGKLYFNLSHIRYYIMIENREGPKGKEETKELAIK